MKRVALGVASVAVVAALAALHALSELPAGGATLGPSDRAPELAGITRWINSVPLTIAGLAGKVVLVEFWTYGCSDCLNTVPQVERLFRSYRDRGLVVIAVHTPEFAFERDAAGLEQAVARLGIDYPVAQDNDWETWRGYRNQYWPARYLVDRRGTIVLAHAGGGGDDEIERTVRALLDAAPGG